MPSTTFPATTSGISYSGPWSDGYQASASCRYAGNSQYATFDFTATGTDCALDYALGTLTSQTIQVSVDGGAYTTLTLPGVINTYTGTTLGANNTLFTALADAAHTVTVRLAGSNAGQFFLNTANALTVTGTAPAISAHSAFSGGTIYQAADMFGLGGVDGVWNNLQATAFSLGYSRPMGLQCKFQDGILRFQGNPTSIKIFTFLNSARARVYQDGVGVGASVQMTAANANPAGPSANQMGWVQLVSGLDGATHDYIIAASDAGQMAVACVMTVGGTIDATFTYPRRGALAVLGDSKTAAVAGTSNDSTLGFGFKLGLAKNRPCYNGGIGSTFLSAAASNPGTDFRYTDATGYAKLMAGSVDYVLVEIGYNDINVASPSPNADLLKAYTNMLTGIRKCVGPSCKILALGILPTTATNASANRSSYNTNVVQQAVTNVADAMTSYFSTDLLWGTGGLPPTSTQINANTTDGTHPTPTGYDALVTLLSPSIATWPPPGIVINRRWR